MTTQDDDHSDGQTTPVKQEKQKSDIEVAVKNPTVVKDGALKQSFIIYDIEGQDKEGQYKVKRRFNDFFELRQKLVENWPGVMVPPLPEKKVKVQSRIIIG